jgi:hypothetical protein
VDSERRQDLIMYGRIITSVVLYALFIIFSVNAVLTATLDEQPLLLGGLLILSVVILPRTSRRAARDTEASEAEEARDRSIRKWLTGARMAYFIIAVFLWFGLPELI